MRMFMASKVAPLVVLACALTACGGDDDNSAPTVATDKGIVSGVRTDTTYSYRGIPYAAPPVGPLRWKAPQPAAAWNVPRDASAFAPHCAQPASSFGVASTSEDCLYLNVYTPKVVGPYPVMVWIHGGALLTGESDDYDARALVAQGVVVVTINYPPRPPGLPVASRAHERGRRRFRQLRPDGPAGGVAMGQVEHRRFRRRPDQRHDLRRVCWRTEHPFADRLAAGCGLVPQGDRREQQLQPDAARSRRGRRGGDSAFATGAGCTTQTAACLRAPFGRRDHCQRRRPPGVGQHAADGRWQGADQDLRRRLHQRHVQRGRLDDQGCSARNTACCPR